MDNDIIDHKPNPYGFIPFIIYPNLRRPKEFWGVSDIPTVQEPQKELNRVLSRLSRILEVSGNPIALLEGGGIRLHIDYIDLVYKTMHDLSESPRAAFGSVRQELSGVALEYELQSLLQKVKRKRRRLSDPA